MHQQQMAAACILFAVDLVKFFFLVCLARKGFDHPDPAQIFLQRARQFGFLLLVGVVGLFDAAKEEDGDDEHEGHDEDRDPGQPPIEQVDCEQVDDEEHHDPPGFNRLVRKKTSNRIDV